MNRVFQKKQQIFITLLCSIKQDKMTLTGNHNQILVICVVFLLLVSSCQSGQKTDSSTSKGTDTIRIATVNWSDNIIMSRLMKHIIEEKFTHPVSLDKYTLSRAYTNVSQGNADLFLSSWQPTTHRDYIDTYGDNLKQLGINYNGAHIGLVVPSYMDVTTIPELQEINEKVKGRIIGIENEAGIVQVTEETIDAYGLDYRVVGTSEAAMISTLKATMKDKEPIIITGWKPHWLFSRFDLKFLDDPKEIYGNEEKIISLGRIGFQERYPQITKLLSTFTFTESQMLSLMDKIEKSDKNPEQVINQWMTDNQEIIEDWMEEVTI